MSAKAAKRSPTRRAASKAARPAKAGRVGSKRWDMRYRDQWGQEWASKLESDLYAWFVANGRSVRKCESGRDSVPYQTSVVGGKCLKCGHHKVCQEHTYTPDLFVTPASADEGLSAYIEAKGYLRPKDRRILRAVNKAGVLPGLHLVLSRHHAPTVAWASKFLKGWRLWTFNAKSGLTEIRHEC